MFNFDAGSLFERLRELAEQRIPKGGRQDPLGHPHCLLLATIEFRSDEDAHNDALQAAARAFATGLMDLIEAGAKRAWGKPDYRLTFEDERFPAWAGDLMDFPDYLIGWRRGRDRVAYVYRAQEDREIPINVVAGVVPWKASELSNESHRGKGLQPLEGKTGKGASKSKKKTGTGKEPRPRA